MTNRCKKVSVNTGLKHKLNLKINDNDQFWKSICRLGIGCERQNKIPMEIIKEDGSLSSKLHDVMAKWKDYFQRLLNPRIESEQSRTNDTYTNDEYEQGDRTSNLTLLLQ